MLGVLIALFVGLSLFSTLIILAACVVSGRSSRLGDEEEAAILQQMQLSATIEELRTVKPQAAPSQA
jgi:hypothetical protein